MSPGFPVRRFDVSGALRGRVFCQSTPQPLAVEPSRFAIGRATPNGKKSVVRQGVVLLSGHPYSVLPTTNRSPPMTAAAAPHAPAADLGYLDRLRDHWKAHKSFPSPARLSGPLGVTSAGCAFDAVARLEEKGYLTKKDGRITPGSAFFAYPVLGSVRAGLVQPAGDTTGAYFPEPANAAFETIRPQASLDVVGRVTGSFRTLKKRR